MAMVESTRRHGRPDDSSLSGLRIHRQLRYLLTYKALISTYASGIKKKDSDEMF